MDVPAEGEEGYVLKEDVGWIVDLKKILASWSLRSDMVGRSARKMALAYGIYTWRYSTRTFSRFSSCGVLHFSEYCHFYLEFRRTVRTIG